MKLVSIITPAYNAELYIEQTINSVLCQTYSNWEMLIVDDCSMDNTTHIVEQYCVADSRIRLLKHEQNQGVAAARNTALTQARGEFIAFLDSDDLWFPQKLEKQIHFMKENGFALTYTSYQMFGLNKTQGGKVIKPPAKMTHKKIFYNTGIACLTVMVDREKVGAFEMPLIKHFEDQCTWQSILKRGYVAYRLKDNLALYRVSSSSLTANKMNAIKQQWNVYRKFYKFTIFRSALYFAGYAWNAFIKRL